MFAHQYGNPGGGENPSAKHGTSFLDKDNATTHHLVRSSHFWTPFVLSLVFTIKLPVNVFITTCLVKEQEGFAVTTKTCYGRC